MNGIHHQAAAAYEGRTEEGRADVSLSLFLGFWAHFFTYHLLPCLLNCDDSIEHDVAASALHSFSDFIRQREFLSEDSQRYVRPVKRNKTFRQIGDTGRWAIKRHRRNGRCRHLIGWSTSGPFRGICTGEREGFLVELTLDTESNVLGSESHCRSDS